VREPSDSYYILYLKNRVIIIIIAYIHSHPLLLLQYASSSSSCSNTISIEDVQNLQSTNTICSMCGCRHREFGERFLSPSISVFAFKAELGFVPYSSGILFT